MLVRMNVEKVLKKIGVTGVDVIHSSVSDATDSAADLFIVGSDLATFVKNLPRVIILDNIMDMEELETKIKEFF